MRGGSAARAAAAGAAALVVVLLIAGPSRAIEPGSRLVVAAELHADGRDAITVCQDRPFGEGVEDFGDSIAAALGLARTEVGADPASDCFALLLTGPITRPGARGERIFRLDGGALRSLAGDAGFSEAFLVVCTPHLTTRVVVRVGDPALEATGCDSGGYAWNLLEPLDVDVAYRATIRDLAAGLMGATSWWIALATLAGLAAVRGRTSRIVKKMPVAAAALGSLSAGAAAYGWFFVVTRSSLLDSLHAMASLGTSGQTAVLSTGSALAVALAAFTTRYTIRASKRPAARPHAGSLLPGVPSLPLLDVVAPYPGIVSRVGAGLLWAFVPSLALTVAYLIFLVTPAALEIKVEGMLAVCVAYALLVPALSGATFPAAFGALRLPSDAETPVTGALRATGSRVNEIWISPVPPASAPAGGAIMISGRRAFVWEPLAALPAEQMAGAIALRGARRRPWAGGAAAMLVVVIMNVITIGSQVPATVLAAAVAVPIVIGFLDVLERIRGRTAPRDPATATEHVRGLLTAGRAHARAAAGGALGVLAVPMPGYAQSHWERTMRITHKIGVESGLSTVEIARIADEVVAADANRPPFTPSPLAEGITVDSLLNSNPPATRRAPAKRDRPRRS